MTEESLVHKALDYDTSKEMQECHFLPREEGMCLWDVLFTCDQSQSGDLNENFPEVFEVMFPIIYLISRQCICGDLCEELRVCQ